MALSASSISDVNNLLNQLGLNQWQLQEGKYNGYTFSVAQTPFGLNGLLSNLSQLGQVGTIAQYGQQIANSSALAVGTVTGANVNNPITGIPGGANVGNASIIDVFSRKVAIQDLPNGADNIRALGYNGQQITIMAVAWGSNYMSYLQNNLVQMFYSDEIVSNDPTKYHVLQHPVWGTIQGCWLIGMRILHDSTRWRAAVAELTFRTEEPIKAINQSSLTQTLSQINNGVSSVLTIANALNGIWNSTDLLINGNGQNSITNTNNIFIQDSLLTIQKNVAASVNNSIVATNILINNLAPNNYNNVALNNYAVTKPTITQFNYFINNVTTLNNIQNLNVYLTNNINTTINIIYNSSEPNAFYNTINYLKSLIAEIGQLSITLINAYYGQTKQYTTPYNMSLFQMCFLNNIDYENNYKNIIQLNQNTFFYLNYIPKDTVMILPVTNGSSGA